MSDAGIQTSLIQHLSSQSTPNYTNAAKESQSSELNTIIQQNLYLQPFQRLLQQQILLESPVISSSTPNILTSVLGSQLKQFSAQLKIQQMKMLRVCQQQVYGQLIQNSMHKIVELNEKIAKVKEFYLYCRHLKNATGDLSQDFEKYYQYAQKQSTIVHQLQNYLKNPIISDIIFRQYLKIYNVNIFTSDLIDHYFQLNLNGLLKQTQTRLFQAQRIPQLVILQKQNVVFKQLYDINLKYSQLQQEIKYSYIHNVITILFKHCENEQKCVDSQHQKIDKKHDTFQGYNNAINEKLQGLNYLIGKMAILGNNLMQNIQNSQMPILVNQYEANFNSLIKYLRFSDHGVVNKTQLQHDYKNFIGSIFHSGTKVSEKQTLRQFFEKNLIFEQENESLQRQNEWSKGKFEFLQQKIIKTESLIVMNKIFSTLNMFSYILQQVNPGSCKQADYTFSSLKTYIEGEFRGEFIHKHSLREGSQIDNQDQGKKSLKAHYHSPSHKAHFNVFIETDDFGNWILLSGNQKLIYPSAISGLVEILHYMLEVATLLQRKALYSRELMLQILILKAQQISKIGQVIFNVYNLIKSKQVSCYSLLNEYMKFVMKGFIEAQLKWLENLDLTQEQHQLFMNELDQLQNNRINTAKERLNGVKQRANSIKERHEQQLEKQYLQQRKTIAKQMMHSRVTNVLTHFAQKAKKADFLSQIIYQLDSNYEIQPVLEQLLTCQRYHQATFYFQDHSQFYQTVLYEIIQMRNHIKLDHYFTLPRLHQTFGFFTAKALSFGDILNQLAYHSTKEIKVEELLTFFGAQLKLKRLVFRGELYWLSYRGESSKTKTFKNIVQEYASDILSLAEESLQYFLNNINEFLKKVNGVDQEIEKFKHYQTITGKMNNSTVKVQNLDTHLSTLSKSQLRILSTVLCSFNPIQSILQNQSAQCKIFSDIRTSIQINNKIKFEDLDKHAFMLEEKQKLGVILFTLKSFGFELGYGECFGMFVQKDRKSYMVVNQGLKLTINRERQAIFKHYQEVLQEDKKNVHLAIGFYRSLIMVTLLSMRDETLDEQDQACIEGLLRHVSVPFDIIDQIHRIRQIFIHTKQSDPTNQELYRLLRIKSALLRILSLTDPNIPLESPSQNNQQAHCIQIICMVGKLSLYAQKRILQRLQQVHYDIIEKQTKDGKNSPKQLNSLNNKIVAYLLNLMNKCQQQYICKIVGNSLGSIQATIQKQNHLIEPIKFDSVQSALTQISLRFLQKLVCLTSLKTHTYSHKQSLNLFSNHCGYKVHHDPENQSVSSLRSKQLLRRNDRKINKKALFSPVRSTYTAHTNIMQNIQKRVGIEMIKQSMGLRKVISRLQLEQKKMKDQIAWQTSKLQHNVIKKINAFITESNIDQQQSYINFKYTVNLQTIKGMQNVIKQQTQLAIKASEETMKIKSYVKIEKSQRNQKNPTSSPQKQSQQSDFFLTNPGDKVEQLINDEQNKLGYQNTRMLNTNIDSIFNHMRKIKVFAAWKKVNRNMDMTNQEWKNFNRNVANLLHNQQNIKKIELINKKRSECFKENILCSLLKEENSILSEKIRNAKMESLKKIVQNYKSKLIGDDE